MKSRISIFILVVGLLSVFLPSPGSGQREFPEEWGERVEYHPSDHFQLVNDIPYVCYGNRKLLLDLYLPVGPTNGLIPCILVIRGGGWHQGDKESFGPVAAYFAENGFAAASIEYRTSEEATFPAAVEDVQAAVAWLYSHGEPYGIDGNSIGAIGFSAGAHLALMVGTNYQNPDLAGAPNNSAVPVRVKAVVALAPVTNFVSYAHWMTAQGKDPKVGPAPEFLGASPDDDPGLWVQASPIGHVDDQSAATLLLHSVSDEVVPYQQSLEILRQSNDVGVYSESYFITGAPHDFWTFARWSTESREYAAAFFKKALGFSFY